VCVRACVYTVYDRVNVHAHVQVEESGYVCGCVFACVCECVRAHVCVCMCERKRVHMCVRVCTRGLHVYVCVCVPSTRRQVFPHDYP